jgi:4-hydroxy-tetrahydrodipicolinate reductase
MSIKVCVAGATGWVGRALVSAMVKDQTFRLVGAVSRTYREKPLGELVGIPNLDILVSGSVEQALKTKTDVLIDYTGPDAVKGHVLNAVRKGVHVVIGTSGLTDEDFAEIDGLAREYGVGVLAAGNFAISAVLLQKFAEIAANFIPHWEIIDYADATKIDAPSGTVRELAYRLSNINKPAYRYAPDEIHGPKESRGATLNGIQVHCVRLPGHVFAFEVLFGLSGERLTLRHEAGNSADPYVQGTLLAARKVSSFIGLKRGLDQVMDFPAHS